MFEMAFVAILSSQMTDGLFNCRVSWYDKSGNPHVLANIPKNAESSEAAEALCRQQWTANGNTAVEASCRSLR